jgi:bisanhydrobacterioruberin hydratase
VKSFWFHWISTGLLAIAFALEIISFFFPLNFGWLEIALILPATASSITALSRQLPAQNVLFVALVISLVGGAVSALGAKTGVPFGAFIYGIEIGPRLFQTLPWVMPLIWTIAILNSRGVARLMLRPWRKTKTYGFRLIGITSALTAAFDFAFEPFATRVKHFWFWEPTKLSWQGAPLVNFLAWAIVTALILAFVTPLLINKQLSKRSAPDFHSLGIWIGAILLFGIGSAVHGLWLAVVADAALGIVTAIFAVRGARW